MSIAVRAQPYIYQPSVVVVRAGYTFRGRQFRKSTLISTAAGRSAYQALNLDLAFVSQRCLCGD